LEEVTKYYAGEAVLDRISLRIEEGEKIGLIGRNGSGKSTIFRIITGEVAPDNGIVERMRKARVACLSQIPDVAPDQRIFDTVLTPFAALIAREDELRALENRIAAGDESVLEQYSALQESFALDGGYEYRSTVKRVIHGLGFMPEDYDLPFESLSGGQRTRLMLALVLLQDADLLLLDEPENHLDMDAREWLEEFIKTSEKAVMVISHDRRLLDEAVGRIVEIERGDLRSFTGNYTFYVEQSALLREQQQKAYDRQQLHIAKQERFIERFRYKNTKATAVQSRIKQLEKIERVDAPAAEADVATFNLGGVVRSGAVVLEARELSKAYGSIKLYEKVSFQVERGERVGIMGPNGSGKTTLLRHLLGDLADAGGEVTLGHKVSVGYYDQHHHALNPVNDIVTEVQSVRPDMTLERLRTFLGRFLFTGDDVFKRISMLSGGERSRVAMAKLVLGEANLLILDEPTNHLDIASSEALEVALAEFPGTLMLVSHDRTLLDRLVNKLVVFGNGSAEVHLGNYSGYRDHQREAAAKTQETRPEKRVTDAMLSRQQKKAEERELRRKRRELEELEAKIHDGEQRLAGFEKQFVTLDPTEYERGEALRHEYEAAKVELEALYGRWEALGDELAQ